MNEKLGKEDIEKLKFIAEIHRRLHDERRKQETQAFLTTVTFLVLSMGAVLAGKTPAVSAPAHAVAGIAFFVLLATAATWYLGGLHDANGVNRGFAQTAEDRIMDSVSHGFAKPEKAGRPLANTRGWQICIIWLLTAANALVLCDACNVI